MSEVANARADSAAVIATDVVRHVSTALLEITYLDSGPRDGHPVLLLHGWPDSAQSWLAVAAQLNAAGLRTIAPYLRGFGPTRFRDPATPRSAQISAIAQDALDLADALALETFSLVGHDWGARAGYLLATHAPQRIQRYAALSIGYGSGPLSFRQQQQFWYQWFFAHPEGEKALRADRHALVRPLRESWSPAWQPSIEQTATLDASIDNPDWIDITLHGYRHRWNLAPGDARYAALDHLQQAQPNISVPTLVLHGADDGCITVDSSAQRGKHFDGPYWREVLPGIGHFPQVEAPGETAAHLLHWLTAEDGQLHTGVTS